MKISENWLREWVDPPVDTAGLAEQMTLLGLEVDEITPARPAFADVVVARVNRVVQHPDADRLRVCEVDDGSGDPVQIVCGAPNVRDGLRVPLARVGGRLPDGTKLKKAKLRGVASFGMLCSAAELGLSEQRDGLMELADTAIPGTALETFLELDDQILTVELTPDRGDCLSVRGLARDLCARNDLSLVAKPVNTIQAEHEETWPVEVDASSACVRYAGCVVTGVDLAQGSPLVISERLRRSGIRTINAAVDVTNTIMLELGQPMHAFDLDKLQGSIRVRLAHEGESLVLLDKRTVTLSADTTVIADDSGAIGIAGIMGGLSTAVDERTTRVFLESALFLPEHVAGKPRHYAAQSESSHRFERGVDPQLQAQAMSAAVALLVEIAGGSAGPIADWCDQSRLPLGKPLALRRERIQRLLGILPDDTEVERILTRLEIDLEPVDEGWKVTPPSHRYDLRIEEDFIEEVVRVHGLDRLPRTSPPHRPVFRGAAETGVPMTEIRGHLVHRGYQEVVTLSFVEARQQAALRPDLEVLALANPISSELSVMRTTLVSGLIDTLRRNRNRQRSDMRLFESGLRFVPGGAAMPAADDHISIDAGDDIQLAPDLSQQSMIAGLVVGSQSPESWAAAPRAADFFDIKADIEALFARANGAEVSYAVSDLPMLHPGQRATILADGVAVGYVGALNPGLQKSLDMTTLPLVFELALVSLRRARLPRAVPLSRFPRVRRDMALLMDTTVSHQALIECIRENAPEFLIDVIAFDVYTGEKIDKGKKSIALGLILQHESRTLEDSEVDDAVARVVAAATERFGAVLRM